MAVSALVLVVALYAAVATSYLEARLRRRPPLLWARIAGPVAVAAHLAGLVALGIAIGRSPFATSSQSVSFLAFALTALYLVLEATSRVATHGGGFYLVATVLAAIGVPGLVMAGAAEAEAVKDVARTWHVGLSLMGTAAVFAGGLLAVGYLGTYRRVKRVALGGGEEGPSLRGFERLSRRAALLGAALLLPAFIMGVRALGTDDTPRGAVVLTGLTALLFVVMAAAGWIWWRRPLRGALAAWLGLAAAVIAVLAWALVHPLVTGHVG